MVLFEDFPSIDKGKGTKVSWSMDVNNITISVKVNTETEEWSATQGISVVVVEI